MCADVKRGGSLNSVSDAELMEYCRALYLEHGVSALTYSFLRKHNNLYHILYSRQIKPTELAYRLGVSDEFQEHQKSKSVVRKGHIHQRWTWHRIVSVVRETKAAQGFLPPAGWFQANGHGSLVQAVYYLGRTWEEVRAQLDDFSGSQFVESRNGMRWRSHPEASLSNFLYSRGITHIKGKRYPEEYAESSGRAYGIYDLHIDAGGRWIDIEIWGDKPKGHDAEGYADKRQAKESFNSRNRNFLGIEFGDCFDDGRLTQLLSPYLEIPAAYIFDKSSDPLIESSHWSNADELLIFCRQLADQMPDGKFPTEEWLRKRGKWAGREGPTYNTASIYIKNWLGGIRVLREILGQAENSTNQWDRDRTVFAAKQFYERTGATPGQVRSAAKTDSAQYPVELVREATNIDAAILKYAGGAKAINELLGIEYDRTRKWTRDAILEAYKECFTKWGLAPSQVIYEFRHGALTLSDNELQSLRQAIDASGRVFSGAAEIYNQLGLSPPRRKRRRRNTLKQS